MANINIDISKTGLQGYRQLQALNNLNTEISDEENINSLSTEDNPPKKSIIDNVDNLLLNYNNGAYREPSNVGEFYTYDDWGKSMFDVQSISEENFQNRFDIRAENQPWYAKVGAGIGKMGVLAVTTFVDGIGGTIFGALNTMADLSSGRATSWDDAKKSFIMNPLSEALQSINEASESWLPNYYTQRELENDENGQWYKNAFTANFWGDKFIKNVGFTLGAAASAILTSGAASKVFVNKGLREAFKGTVYKAAKEGGERVALSNADDVYKAMRNGEKLFTKSGEVIEEGSKLMKDLQESAKQLKRAEWGLKLAGSVNSAMGEGRIEAIGAVKELQEKEYNNINEWANNAIEGVSMELYNEHPEWFSLVNVGTTDNPRWENQLTSPEGLAEYERRTKYITDKQNALLQQASMKSADIANYVFLSNVALLSFSNFVQFGRAISGGFTTANNFKSLIKNVTKNEAKKEGGKEVLKETTKRLGEEGVEATVNKGAIRRKVARAVANPFMEGFEEISQASITAGAGLQIGSELNEYARNYHADLLYDSMFADSIDLEAQDYAVSYLNSLLDGAVKTYGKSQSWEEFSIGFLTGMLGIPKVGRRANGKKGLQMSGELWEGIRDAKQMKQEAQSLVNAINARINSPEMKAYYKGFIRHTKGEIDMMKYITNDDQFNFENSKFKQIISDAIMFDKAGRLEDFYEMIDDWSQLGDNEQESFKTITGLTQIPKRGNDGKILKDQDGKEILEPIYQNYTIKQMNAKLKERAEDTRKAVDYYVKNANALKNLYGDNISSDTVEEIVYGLSQLDNWNDRSRELLAKLSNTLKGDMSIVNAVGVGNEKVKERLGLNDIDEEFFNSFNDIFEYFDNNRKNVLGILLNAVEEGNLKKEDFAKAYDYLIATSKEMDVKQKKDISDVDLKLKHSIDDELKNFEASIEESKEEVSKLQKNLITDRTVKNSILDNILAKLLKGDDILKVLNTNNDVKEDLEDIIEEAVKRSGSNYVAGKIVEWQKYLEKVRKYAANDYKGKKGTKNVWEDAYNKLFDLLYEDYGKEYDALEKDKANKFNAINNRHEELMEHLRQGAKKRKSDITNNYLKVKKNLSDRMEDITKKVENLNGLNSISIAEYKRQVNDLMLIYASKVKLLEKLKTLSEHPEWYTEEAKNYRDAVEKAMKEKVNNVIREKIEKCTTVQEVRRTLEEEKLSYSEQKEILDGMSKDISLELQNIIKEYLKIEKYKTVAESINTEITQSNSKEGLEVVNTIMSTIDKASTFKSLTETLNSKDFIKNFSEEGKEIANTILTNINKAYTASNTTTNKDTKEQSTTNSNNSSTNSNNGISSKMKQFMDNVDNDSKEETEEPTPKVPASVKQEDEEDPEEAVEDKEDDENDKAVIDFDELQKKDPDSIINALKRFKASKLEEIKKTAPKEMQELIDTIISGKPTKEYGNFTKDVFSISKNGEGASVKKSMQMPVMPYNDIVNPDESNAANNLVDNSDKTAFHNWTFTKYRIPAIKRGVMQLTKISEAEKAYNSFMEEYNAFRYVDEGFLGKKYRKAKKNGHNVKIHFIQVSDNRLNYKKEEPDAYTILQCVALTKAEKEELEKKWGADKVKLIKQVSENNGIETEYYYQVIGSISYTNFNNAAQNLSIENSSIYKSIMKKVQYDNNNKYKGGPKILGTLKTLLDNYSTFEYKDNKELLEALREEYHRTKLSLAWFTLNTSFEGIRKATMEGKMEVNNRLSIVTSNGEIPNSANNLIIKHVKAVSEIKTIYNGRLVKGTVDADHQINYLKPITDDSEIKWQPNTNLTDIPVNEYKDTKLNGKTLHLGFYYGNGDLRVPSIDDNETIVQLKSNNNDIVTSKYKRNAGSVWLMVRTADGRLYPKALSIKRFNELEYPIDDYLNKSPEGRKNIMDKIYDNIKVMVDPDMSSTDKARAKAAISNLIYIPVKYKFKFSDDNTTISIKGGISNDTESADGTTSSVKIDLSEFQAEGADKEALINKYAKQVLGLLHDERFSFRFQVSPNSIAKDGDGMYRQMLLDSNIFTTNLPIISNVGASFDTYPVMKEENDWKVIKDEPVSTIPSGPVKFKVEVINDITTITFGKNRFNVTKQEDGSLYVKPTEDSDKTTATKEEQCACKLVYCLKNDTTINGITKIVDNVYKVLPNKGNGAFIFEATISEKGKTVTLTKKTIDEQGVIQNDNLKKTAEDIAKNKSKNFEAVPDDLVGVMPNDAVPVEVDGAVPVNSKITLSKEEANDVMDAIEKGEVVEVPIGEEGENNNNEKLDSAEQNIDSDDNLNDNSIQREVDKIGEQETQNVLYNGTREENIQKKLEKRKEALNKVCNWETRSKELGKTDEDILAMTPAKFRDFLKTLESCAPF